MAIFDRIRRSRSAERGAEAEPQQLPLHLLPQVNQRVTVTAGGHVPVGSRVEDVVSGMLELALPSLPVEFGDTVVVAWEREDVWFSLETRVLGVLEDAPLPVLRIAGAGTLSRLDEGRSDARRPIALPISVKVLRARALRAGRELSTTTVDVSGESVRFETTAPFAPGDLLEARINLGGAAADIVSARVKVIRIDTAPGSWRTTCAAAWDEMLRSDRARLMAHADAARANRAAAGGASPTPALTADGVGGRDQPHELADLDSVVEWLRRRG